MAVLWCIWAASCGGPEDPACPNDLPASCPSPAPSYTDVEPIFQSRCVSCHAPGGLASFRPFTSYDLIAPHRSEILNQVYACRMPLSGAPPLTAEQRKTLLSWLVCGAPE